MSVTFGTSPVPYSRYAFSCGRENGVTDHDFQTHRAACEFLTELEQHGGTGHLAVCGDEYCRGLHMFVHSVAIDPTPSLRISGSSAYHVLHVLGLESSPNFGGCGKRHAINLARSGGCHDAGLYGWSKPGPTTADNGSGDWANACTSSMKESTARAHSGPDPESTKAGAVPRLILPNRPGPPLAA